MAVMPLGRCWKGMVRIDLQLDDPFHKGAGMMPTVDEYDDLYSLMLDACRSAGLDVKAEMARIHASWVVDPSAA